ncbi:hypothetical protein EVAR_48662_1 [Eumeta japonica]|uniref:Uncharacterized protein n=1 Tax=Eumeta variegata TaxID=151549 RepID=A0A4C1XBA9_EUMVA|nr:hypothetical protein EVAR_48662_1 [Eumeta japonica]
MSDSPHNVWLMKYLTWRKFAGSTHKGVAASEQKFRAACHMDAHEKSKNSSKVYNEVRKSNTDRGVEDMAHDWTVC